MTIEEMKARRARLLAKQDDAEQSAPIEEKKRGRPRKTVTKRTAAKRASLVVTAAKAEPANNGAPVRQTVSMFELKAESEHSKLHVVTNSPEAFATMAELAGRLFNR
jgi:hypothetical protein